jgi:hypothetical protein
MGDPIGKKLAATDYEPSFRTFATSATAAGKPAGGNDDILYVGMNPLAPQEVDSVRKVSKGTITPVYSAKEQGTITIQVAGKPLVCDLRTKTGLDAFIRSLKLPPEQSAKIAAIFERFNKTGMEGIVRHGGGPVGLNFHGRGNTADALDELAQIAQVWAKAEHGGTIPSRMVLSGHGAGEGIFGEGNATLTLEMLGALAEAMPKAAGQVEDLHISACYGGSRRHVDIYRAMFPNVKTIFAYANTAPGTYSGVADHLSRWERATRGRTNDIDRQIVDGTRKGANVAVWSAKDGYDDGRVMTDLQSLREDLAARGPDFDAAYRGDGVITDPHGGPVRAYYDTLQALLGRTDLPDSERASLEAKRDATIRLLYFTETVAPKFADHFAADLKAGYDAVGMPVPDFAHMSRKQVLAAIAVLRDAVNAKHPAGQVSRWDDPGAVEDPADKCLRLLVHGLGQLESQYIPDEWL